MCQIRHLCGLVIRSLRFLIPWYIVKRGHDRVDWIQGADRAAAVHVDGAELLDAIERTKSFCVVYRWNEVA